MSGDSERTGRATSSRERLERAAGSVKWFHSIDLGDGLVTSGIKPATQLEHELAALRLPDLAGKTVLDIGAWDGYFSFAAERLGASRIVALDHYVWSLDLAAHFAYWEECRRRGVAPRPYHEMDYWKPAELPGKRGFDLARAALGSEVEERVADFMIVDLAALGTFDVVLYLGVLYHMENPLEAMRRVFAATRELAVIETEAVVIPGQESRALFEFYPGSELAGDVSNWWAPNRTALEGLCRAAGFTRVEMLALSPSETDGSGTSASEPIHYRAVVQARR
jgi:tRNA (mo5U34)-methyltransferase